MFEYNKVLLDCIKREEAGTDYFYTESDKIILQELLREINECTGTNLRYLAELDAFNVRGSGEIISRYITRFSSESVRAYLIPQMVFDKVKDCDKIILQLYLRFKESDEYIPNYDNHSPAHIYVRYDNAFKNLKSKRIKDDLMLLAHHPRDVVYLPFTIKMLASWKIPELKELLFMYLKETSTLAQSFLYTSDYELEYIRRELKFISIVALKYYPSVETNEIIRKFITDSDLDIRAVAKKTWKSINNQGTVL